jgi:hypothetical protein
MPVPTCDCVTVRVRSRRPPPHAAEHAAHVDHGLTRQSRGHGVVLHACASESSGQSGPLCVTVRERDCVPLPHDTVHAVQVDHCDTAHMHAPRSHGNVSLSAPHAVPPLAGGVTTLRVRRKSPGPHVCEHELQVDQLLISQLTGHNAGEHDSFSLSGGHCAPPHEASVVTVRAREREPVPHVTEHDDHAAQLVTTHDTGQQPKPQLAVSDNAGHAVPPLAGACVTVRVRSFVADVPHVAVHAPHADQFDTVQCTGGGGHVPGVHELCSLVKPGQMPPHDCGVCTLRVRVCKPVPHVTLHADHDDHAAHVQLTGQHPPLAVHDSISESTSHVPPHDSGVETERERERLPLPHVTEHGDHPDHGVNTQF